MSLKTRNKQYLVSAIVSTFNSERFIRGCLEDLDAQTLREHLEIIVIDSGSQENEKDIVREIQESNDNLVYIRTEERETVYAAWNRGIRASRGKYITNANTDDRHRKDAFERMVDVLEQRPDIALVYADSAITEEENQTFESADIMGHFWWPEFNRWLLFQTCYIGPHPLWRKEIHRRYGYFNDEFTSAGDYEFWLRIAVHEYFYHIPDVLGLYLLSPEGIESGNVDLSHQEAERARALHWPESWGKRIMPGGHCVVPVHPSSVFMQDRERLLHYYRDSKSDDRPLVSVIVPTYERPGMLSEALKSILLQTTGNYEILVVNDGGNDVSDIIAPYKNFAAVEYINIDEKRGPAAARNAGLKRAKGKYVAYLDDDDIYYSSHLEETVGFLESNNVNVVFTDSYEALQKKCGDNYVLTEKRLTFSEEFDRERLLVENYIPTLNIVHRRDCIDETGLFDESLETHEDWDMWIRMSQKYDFHHIKAMTAEYTTRSDSSNSSTSRRSDFLRTMKIIHSRYAHLTVNPDIKKQQEMIQVCLEKEIYINEKITPADADKLFIPMNGSTSPPTMISGVSVIIPVMNGGEQLRALLRKIRSQKKVENIEIVVLDSESTDKSVKIAGEYGAKVFSVPKQEFNHGSTRNLGAENANGDYLVFTVQDAMPVSNYWLYKLLSPLIVNPEIEAVSSKQYIKPEADLFSLWENQRMRPHSMDCMWSLPGQLAGDDWKFVDPAIKGRLMHFDDVSSCVRKIDFERVKYNPLMFGEDMDYGKRVLERGGAIGYLASTGVYHWHERDAGHLLKRYYTGTGMTAHIQRNNLPYFFRNNKMNFNSLMAHIEGAYDVIGLSIHRTAFTGRASISVIKSFVHNVKENIKKHHRSIEKEKKLQEGLTDESLDSLLRQITGDNTFSPEQKYDFKRNIIIPGFMDHFSRFSEYVCAEHNSLEGREKDYTSCVYKIFSMTAGIALGAFYLEEESLGRLTPGLKRVDRVLGEGVCYPEGRGNGKKG